MKRIPEPELMEEPDQARAYAEADFEEPHAIFVERFRQTFPEPLSNAWALDLGCGPADVTMRFARACPGVQIDAVDGSEAMLALGREAVARAGLSERIRLHRVRLPAQKPPRAAYDVLISNSLLHHLADPRVLWNAVKRWAAPVGGRVFIMDLMRPQNTAEWDRLVEQHAVGAPDVLRRDFRASLAAAYRPQEITAQLAAAGLSHFAVEVISDRHLIAWGRLGDRPPCPMPAMPGRTGTTD